MGYLFTSDYTNFELEDGYAKGGWGYWTVYYTSPQGFVLTFTTLVTFIEF